MPGLSKFPLSKVFNYNLFFGVFSSSQLVIICLCLLQTVGEIEKEKVCVCVCERERESKQMGRCKMIPGETPTG